jgi:lipopolysaccharide export system ATP-binding protein
MTDNMAQDSDLGSRAAPERPRSELVATGLHKRYGRREVVRGAGLTVHSAEVVGLLGPNGAGKTTTFYMIVGLVGADAGQITLDGTSIINYPMHQRASAGVGYLPQEASVFKRLSVRDNILAVLELQQDPATGKLYKRAPLMARLQALLEDLQITHIASSSAASLSGGERRRVEIARALACNPRFILLDEPFAGVDPIAVIEIQRIVRFLKERGLGVLITDHNVRETLGIVDRAYIISEGQVLATGTPTELIHNETVRRVYLGEHFSM